MKAQELALVQGMADTRAALRRWNERPEAVLLPWLRLSALITACLLGAVAAFAAYATPDEGTLLLLPGVNAAADGGDFVHVLIRNALVLALHGFACVAGFMAGSSLPQVAAGYTGIRRTIHDRAGPLAIGFVIAATAFSLFTQAFILGATAADIAAQLNTSPYLLLLGLMPHAVPELCALFLPLAAWTIASRRGEWNELLAATFVTVGLAVPVLLASGAVEVWLSPRLVLSLTGAAP